MTRFIFVFAAVCVSFSAQALDFSLCDVQEVVADGLTNGHVGLSCAINNIPTCAVPANNYIAMDRSTSEGRQFFSMLIIAQATGAKVSGKIDRMSCPSWQPNVARLTHLRMQR